MFSIEITAGITRKKKKKPSKIINIFNYKTSKASYEKNPKVLLLRSGVTVACKYGSLYDRKHKYSVVNY